MDKVKPPLGLIPRWRHVELRLEEIYGAIERYMHRYKDESHSIPKEWTEEMYLLLSWLKDNLPTSPLLKECPLPIAWQSSNQSGGVQTIQFDEDKLADILYEANGTASGVVDIVDYLKSLNRIK